MLNDFHPEIKDKIIAATKYFSIARNVQVGTEALILALVEMKSSILNTIIKDNYLDVDNLIDYIERIIILRKELTGYTSKFMEVCKEAKRLATNDNTEYIFDEHLLYALVNVENTVAIEILEEVGLSKEELLEYLNVVFEEDDTRKYLVNLTKEALEGKLNPFIGRSDYIERIIRILSKKQKNNPLLIGSAGVGKSALVEGVTLAYTKINPSITVYRLDLGTIIAGTKYRGDLEERLLDAINKLKSPTTIVFIDEIHNIVSSSNNESTLDIANILKPVLARSEIKCIGATTLDEYYRYIDKDKALTRRFQNIFVEEPSTKETKEILMGIKKTYEEFYKIKYSNEIIDYIIKLSNLFPNKRFPDKSIDIMDEAGLIGATFKRNVLKKDVEKVVYESLGISYSKIKKNIYSVKNFPMLKKYYFNYITLINEASLIMSIATCEKNIKFLLEDFNYIFNIKEEQVLELDFSTYSSNHQISSIIGASSGYVGYEEGGILTEHVYKYPISVVIIKNYSLGSFTLKSSINEIVKKGKVKDAKGRDIYFNNTIFIFVEEEKKESAGFITDKEKCQMFTKLISEALDEINYIENYDDSIKQILSTLKQNGYKVLINFKIQNEEIYHKAKKILLDINNFSNKNINILNLKNKEIVINN